MIAIRFVPAAEWAAEPFRGFNTLLRDENGLLGAWDGAAYQVIAGGGTGSSHLGTVADEAAMVAESTAVVGSTVYRSDTSSLWILEATPYSSAGNWRDLGALGSLADVTTAATAATAQEKAEFRTATGTAAYNAVKEETASFTLIAADHSNRRVDAGSGSAIAVTWDTGHGMTVGDCGRIMQTGAGAVTISAGTGTLTLAPGVSSAATTARGSWLDWEYIGGDEIVVTARGAAAAGSSSGITFERFYTAASPAAGTGNNTKLARWIVPRSLLVAGFSIRVFAAINGGGTTDSLNSAGCRAGAVGTAYSSMTAMFGGINASNASNHCVIDAVIAMSLDDATLLEAVGGAGITTPGTNAASNIYVLDIDSFAGDLEIAIGCNVSTTDDPYVETAAFFLGSA